MGCQVVLRIHGARFRVHGASLWPDVCVSPLLEMCIQRLCGVGDLALLALAQPVDLAQRSQHARAVVDAIPIQDARRAGAGWDGVGRGEGMRGDGHRLRLAGRELGGGDAALPWVPGVRARLVQQQRTDHELALQRDARRGCGRDGAVCCPLAVLLGSRIRAFGALGMRVDAVCRGGRRYLSKDNTWQRGSFHKIHGGGSMFFLHILTPSASHTRSSRLQRTALFHARHDANCRLTLGSPIALVQRPCPSGRVQVMICGEP